MITLDPPDACQNPLTEPHGVLRELADAYRVPAVIPHSADPEDYRELAGMTTLAAEAEAWLRQVGGAP